MSTHEHKAANRVGESVEDLKQSFLDHLHFSLGRTRDIATPQDLYQALALTIRDRVNHFAIHTVERFMQTRGRAVAYMSAEYLPGPHAGNNLLNLGLMESARKALGELGYKLDDLLEQEEEPGLGNGGLGRLASCFMDSLATLQAPAIGYGIRYEFGIFDQMIRDGWQVEITDKWLRFGNPWETPRPEIAYEVGFGGRTQSSTENGKYRVRWLPDVVVKGVAHDTPILGYRVESCNMLRLWKAEAIESFDFGAFNRGNYYGAVETKMQSENISKVLYPNDELAAGKMLRLQQQFFFVTCSLQDMIHIHLTLKQDLKTFGEKFAIQLNDTHPAIAVAELMRLLVDVHQMEWEDAWKIVQRCIAYTNHTLLPEALETWSVNLLGTLLPRHLEIIYEINARFLAQVRIRFPQDEGLCARVSLIAEGADRKVRMANLATVAAHTVNGVAQLHSELLKTQVMQDFAKIWPDKFCNVTNGVTPRRFVALANPRLAELITRQVGDGWLADLSRLRKLEAVADQPAFAKQWREVKLAAKRDLASLIEARTGIKVDPQSLFDVQVKRLHEYKRQHLNVLHILTLYLRLKEKPKAPIVPRTFIFGAKAAPGYTMAKLIIKLINACGQVINNDPEVKDRLKVVFFPDFNVKNAQHIYPAADLSEQISTAGKEASGTGNMKFSMNGALTIGTLDGANVEIREEVGQDNFFLFGLTAEQVREIKAVGYKPYEYRDRSPMLRAALDFIASGALAGGDTQLFRPLVDNLLWTDPFLVLADYDAYIAAQEKVSTLWQMPDQWTRMSILNAARVGKFSSDRSIRDYCERVWKVTPPPPSGR